MSETSHDTVESKMNVEDAGGCPVAHGRMSHPTEGSPNERWWPQQLNLKILRKHPAAADPMDADYDYPSAFATVDLAELRRDVEQVMTTSQPWWPADYGHYGPSSSGWPGTAPAPTALRTAAAAPAPACSASRR